jgi:hypothetical protein
MEGYPFPKLTLAMLLCDDQCWAENPSPSFLVVVVDTKGVTYRAMLVDSYSMLCPFDLPALFSH